MTLIRLTHANLNTSMYLTAELVAGFYRSEAHKCTHVVATGGAVFPALESVDDVKRLVTGEGKNASASSPKEG